MRSRISWENETGGNTKKVASFNRSWQVTDEMKDVGDVGNFSSNHVLTESILRSVDLFDEERCLEQLIKNMFIVLFSKDGL